MDSVSFFQQIAGVVRNLLKIQNIFDGWTAMRVNGEKGDWSLSCAA